MNTKPLIRAEAATEIDDARLWYEGRQTGLGDDFMLCLGESLARISRNPEMFPNVHRDLRRAKIRRFPYGILYRILNQRIVVVGVVHDRRGPGQWKSRT